MPLRGVPDIINPELLYVLARMGHGDRLVIADANFPSDSVAESCVVKQPIRVNGCTSEVLQAVLSLFPLDPYCSDNLAVMDRVEADKARDLHVPAYEALANAANVPQSHLAFVDRFAFYEQAKKAFAVVQTDDRALYANCIVAKGVL